MISRQELVAIINSKGLNLSSLADKMGKSRATIHNWIGDMDELSKSQKIELCDAIGIHYEDIFEMSKVEEPRAEYSKTAKLELELKILENQAKILDRLDRIEKILNKN